VRDWLSNAEHPRWSQNCLTRSGYIIHYRQIVLLRSTNLTLSYIIMIARNWGRTNELRHLPRWGVV